MAPRSKWEFGTLLRWPFDKHVVMLFQRADMRWAGITIRTPSDDWRVVEDRWPLGSIVEPIWGPAPHDAAYWEPWLEE
jgi:hypothetical protein